MKLGESGLCLGSSERRDEARQLIDSIDISAPSGLRDRALLGIMVYSFARVSAVVAMDAGDYYQQGNRW
ncbi:site-specific integrase [Tunturibacter empetritectus]|uniref:Site-specific recombinase XerC n=1 Tax=Tunturiibacter lichenicola TaxID=2051959 RepID=A0A7W8JBL6_9BACT|nr:hypothetical protein [Edaphobacter lichenicola]MBB5346284.1 site-specific recombinase XerC [Edaphobacter lichenicola]